MPDLPDGTVTLLFADIDSSTRHLLRLGDRYPQVLERQLAIVTGAVERQQGRMVDTQGDTSFAAFVTAYDAILAAIDTQRALASEPWPDGERFQVRIGIHTGEPTRNGNSYTGIDVHRAARICSAAHGGQVLISQTTRHLIAHALDPDTALLDLGHHLLKDLPRPEYLIQVAGAGLARDFPPPRTLGAPAGLPPHHVPLIGREDLLETCQELVLRNEIRLLSLTGPGGTGKTSLAVHLASALMPHFEDGVYFVPLAPISDPSLVPRAVTRALGVQETGSRPMLDTLTDALGVRHSLLVLDNFEHVLPSAPFLSDLILACPRLKVVVTSREVLRISLEYDVPVLPLSLPSVSHKTVSQLERNDAVRLFVARAQAVRPSFALSDDSAMAVGEICRRLDGLPLALELAAARVRLLPPRALLARLDRRLPILTDGPRDLPARQRTLRDTIGWSYGLLGEEERLVFRRLGVFVGGCTLEAVEALCDDPDDSMLALDHLSSLVDKSLVRQSLAAAEPRFSLLETIREFALDQLEAAGEGTATRRRHADHVLQLAEEADPLLIGADQVTWLDRLETEHGNLVAALTWARDVRDSGDRTAGGVPANEAGLRLGRRAALVLVAGWACGRRAPLARRGADLGRGWGREAARLRALYAAGTLAMIEGAYDDAFRLLDDGARMAETLGDTITMGRCLTYRGIVETYFHEAGHLDATVPFETARRAADLLNATDDAWGKALAASQIGAHSRRTGDFDAAEEILVRAANLARATGERYLIGSCLPKLGNVRLDQRDFAGAEPLYAEALSAFRDLREVWWSGRCMQYLARAAHGRGNDLLATLMIGGSDAIFESGGARRIPKEHNDYLTLVQELREALGEESFADTFDRGQQLSLEAVLALVFEEPAVSGSR